MPTQKEMAAAWDAFEAAMPPVDFGEWRTTMLRDGPYNGRGVIVIQVGDIGRYDWLRLYSHIQRLMILADHEGTRLTEPERAV